MLGEFAQDSESTNLGISAGWSGYFERRSFSGSRRSVQCGCRLDQELEATFLCVAAIVALHSYVRILGISRISAKPISTNSNLAQMHGLDRMIPDLLEDQPGALARGQDIRAQVREIDRFPDMPRGRPRLLVGQL